MTLPPHAHPLSFGQQQLWLLQQLAPGQTAYNLPRVFTLDGLLDAEALARAFQAVVDRHAVLRTRFAEHGGQVLQWVQPSLAFTLQRQDLRGLADAAQQAALDAAVRELALHVFDLAQAPVMQARLVQLHETRHVLVVCLHHIASDAGSNPVLATDLAEAYRLARQQPGAVALPPLPLQYTEHATQQREALQGEALAARLAHWNAYLGPEVPALALPTDHARPALPRFEGRALGFALPTPLCLALREFCRAERCTPFVVLLTAWQLLLGRWSGQQDFAIGVPHAGRDDEALQGLMGFFVNTLVHRVRLSPAASLRDICRRVRADALDALAHADLPFELLSAQRSERREPGRSPLFQVMLGVQMAQSATLALDGLQAGFVEFDDSGAKFDLSLDFYIGAEGVQGRLEYSSALFEPATAQWLARAFEAVLGQLLHAPEQRYGALHLVDEPALAQLARWGDGGPAMPGVQPVHQQIAAQARATPAAIALVMAGEGGEAQSLRYDALEARANQLAHALLAGGLQPEQRVGVAMPRSLELVIALLAVLKAGAAFVPLDPTLPAERLAYMATDSGVALVLTLPGESLPALAAFPQQAVSATLAATGPTHSPALPVHAAQLAYVLYTSGSTGRPKGAANVHGALHNRLAWMQQAYPLAVGETVLQKTPIGFDVSVWEFFWPLTVGASLALAAPEAHRDPARLAEAIRRHAVKTLHFVPSMLQAFLADETVARSCTGVRDIVCSGEALPAELQRRLAACLPQARLHNLYGPTEAAIDVTHWTCRPEDAPLARPVPIGAPIAGLRLRVLDADLNPVAPGTPGELFLGGVGLARGYLGKPGLSAERFVADPLAADGARLYRTGDLVRHREDGQLEYLGRLDHQLKLRGQRIELGEIEAQLLSQPGVREAVVVALPAAGAPAGAAPERLVAYLAPEMAGDAVAAHQAALARVLPAYMLPARFVTLPRLPLNANGKIDRKALPEPQAPSGQAAGGAPLQPGEAALAKVWAEVLNLPMAQLGRDANFFDLGGHSLRLVALQAALKQQLDLQVPLVELFAHTTIAALARHLAAREQPAVSTALQAAGDDAARQREALMRRRRAAAAGALR
ncbi:MAG TPA: amino acid adenylation domain-containing protein [Ideonella sp.]|uniref:amino acid adenylation domain-containing protein n=1 Tax=Ideonella sp. TaxID=1929293 RepID=UPI002C8820DB|nr:amino acid adenylation domain-containing protein [Ideonella sp.]HSI49088.1 amino acid adenylation domain-containing protein [Ideonella sp.]